MTTVEKAASIYRLEPCGGTFRSDLEAHLIHGFVFSRPDVFLMMRPVRKDAPPHEIINPWHVFHGPTDCWHVWLFAGNLAKTWDFLPWEMPWVSLERRNVLKFYRIGVLKRRSI